MESSETNTRPKKKLKKFLLYGTLFLIVVLVSAHFMWLYSGSNEWNLVIDKKGVQVYTLKSPGSVLNKTKGVVRVHSTLGTLVKYMQDPAGCYDVGCYDVEMIEWVNSQLQYYTLRWDYPLMFETREFVMKSEFSQDPQTKVVFYENSAAPDKIPPKDCCFRVRHLRSKYRFTPLGNDEVEVEQVLDMDEGGFIPYILPNRFRPFVVYSFLSKLQGYLNKEKYQNATFDFIEEKSHNVPPELITSKTQALN